MAFEHAAPGFIIRPLQPEDAPALRDAVLANQSRLQTDFPGTVAGHRDADSSADRTAKNAALTANPEHPFGAYVALSPDESQVFGMGTIDGLSRRTFTLLVGVSLRDFGPLLPRNGDWIGGWTTRDAPQTLALEGMRALLEISRGPRARYEQGEGTEGTCGITLTAVREANTAAQKLATNAGMHCAKSVADPSVPARLSTSELRVAGVKGLPKGPKNLWFVTNREHFYADRHVG